MEILVALGDIFGAESLIDVGRSKLQAYPTLILGDAGLEFLDELAKDGKVKVLTTLEPCGHGFGELAATWHQPRIRGETKSCH